MATPNNIEKIRAALKVARPEVVAGEYDISLATLRRALSGEVSEHTARRIDLRTIQPVVQAVTVAPSAPPSGVKRTTSTLCLNTHRSDRVSAPPARGRMGLP